MKTFQPCFNPIDLNSNLEDIDLQLDNRDTVGVEVQVYDVTNGTNAVAAIMIFLNSMLGIFFNILIIYNFIKDNKQKNSFNLICVIRAVNNLFVLSVTYLGIFLPITVIGYSFYPPLLETVLISIGLNCNIYNKFQSIFMAINRLFAIFFPLKYDLIFGIKATLSFHIIVYLDRARNLTFENIDRYKKASNTRLGEVDTRIRNDWQSRKINDTLVQMTSDYSNPQCPLLFVNPASRPSTWSALLEDVTIHFLSVLKVGNFNFELSSQTFDPDISSFFVWKYCRKFNNFEITNLYKPQISLDEMAFLSRDIEAETLHIRRLKTDPRFGGTFNCKKLELMHSEWTTKEFLNSDRYTHILIHVIPVIQQFSFDEVLKNWMQGGHEKLESFYVSTFPYPWNMRSMLDGIDQMPTNFLNFELQLRSKYWRLSDVSVDIKRATDGRLATVLLDDNSFLLLLVWHEKHFKLVSSETKTKLRELKLIKE